MPEDAETVKRAVALPFAGGVTEAGMKLHDTPAGRFAQESATALAKPPVERHGAGVLALLPCWTLRLRRAHERLKSGVRRVGVALTQLLARP